MSNSLRPKFVPIQPNYNSLKAPVHEMSFQCDYQARTNTRLSAVSQVGHRSGHQGEVVEKTAEGKSFRENISMNIFSEFIKMTCLQNPVATVIIVTGKWRSKVTGSGGVSREWNNHMIISVNTRTKLPRAHEASFLNQSYFKPEHIVSVFV